MKNLESQKSWILSEMKKGRVLTHLDAEHGCGCARIAARVNELRREGHTIVTEFMTTATGKRVGAYRLMASGVMS